MFSVRLMLLSLSDLEPINRGHGICVRVTNYNHCERYRDCCEKHTRGNTGHVREERDNRV